MIIVVFVWTDASMNPRPDLHVQKEAEKGRIGAKRPIWMCDKNTNDFLPNGSECGKNILAYIRYTSYKDMAAFLSQ